MNSLIKRKEKKIAKDYTSCHSIYNLKIPFNFRLYEYHLFLFLISALLFSCDKNRIYEKNIPIEKNIWDSKVIALYPVEISDTSLLYNIYVNIRHTDNYPYQNIWLNIGTEFPDGNKATKRIEVMLSTDAGKWFGEGLGDIWDYRSMIEENAYFQQPGLYTFSIEQNMRADPLPGIMSAGLRIENTGIKRRPR
ncbi:MAG: gliding motility lipoprotein GldH [Chitinophagales bacterium]|nr:gliding motility lipoprotein GldH [Chitinophagales bacterium]